jgi:putative aldouronate transport system substrate-binding protein
MYQLSRRQLLAAGAGAAALALAGCSSDNQGDTKKGQDFTANKEGAMDSYGVGDQFKATAPLSFSIMMLSNAAYPYNKDWLFFSELAKRTNVTLQSTVVPGSDYNQKRSVMVSSGDAPLLIPKTYHPDEEAYIAGGAILPVSDYLDLMPHFTEQVAKWNLQSDIDTLREEDGKFYLLPGLHEDVWLDYSLAVRTDILQTLNLSVPKTWDELHTVLTAMKAAYPNQYPMSDRWSTPPNPGGNNLLAMVGQGFGTQAAWDYQPTDWDAKANKFVLSGTMDRAAEVRHRQVVRDELQRADAGQRVPGGPQGDPGRDGRQDSQADGAGGKRQEGKPAGKRHDDLGEGARQQELRGHDAIRRLAVLLARWQGIRQMGYQGHDVQRQCR